MKAVALLYMHKVQTPHVVNLTKLLYNAIH